MRRNRPPSQALSANAHGLPGVLDEEGYQGPGDPALRRRVPLVAGRHRRGTSLPLRRHIRDLVLHVFDCEQSVCGRIVWLEDAARRASQCGKTIIWGLEAKSPTDWTGGSILDPNNGATYQLSASYEPDGTLRARIFRGAPIIGKTEILKRVDAKDLVGRC
jgi:hypothetical protein